MIIKHCYTCSKCIRFFNINEEDDNLCPYCNQKGAYVHSFQYDENADKVIGEHFVIPSRKEKDPFISSGKYNFNSSTKPTITCPYCQSTDCKKISGMSRWASTGLFGLASGKLGKQWHCNNCKSDF